MKAEQNRHVTVVETIGEYPNQLSSEYRTAFSLHQQANMLNM